VNEIDRISATARHAATARDWNQVNLCALEIRRRAPGNAEGPFLLGLARKAAAQLQAAAENFAAALELDAGRYDAAVELAWQYILLNRHGNAHELLEKYAAMLSNSPLYLDLAGQCYLRLGFYGKAWPLFERAVELQPEADSIRFNMAGCAVYLGKIDEARAIYQKLLEKHPSHQRNHYELAQLGRARDDRHVKQMLKVLRKAGPDPARNIFLYYALGKELEDLGRWEQAFEYYEKGGNAARSTMNYDVAADVAVMDMITEVCTREWLEDDPVTTGSGKTPVFIVGLPRTGTTLAERILSCHSEVESIGETQVLQMVLGRLGGATGGKATASDYTERLRQALTHAAASAVAAGYMEAVAYRLGDAPFFVDKLPENVLHLGIIAKAWPKARIVHLRRHPMDACFAMYKQSYFRFAYTLDDLAEHYLAYDRLSRHWRDVLAGRMVEVRYEDLVGDTETAIRGLLEKLELPFEDACLHFEENLSPIATASSVQVREKAHTRSVGKWNKFARQLEPLRARLESGEVDL
jgi:tetratricopeptide (TPR) repeat protein